MSRTGKFCTPWSESLCFLHWAGRQWWAGPCCQLGRLLVWSRTAHFISFLSRMAIISVPQECWEFVNICKVCWDLQTNTFQSILFISAFPQGRAVLQGLYFYLRRWIWWLLFVCLLNVFDWKRINEYLVSGTCELICSLVCMCFKFICELMVFHMVESEWSYLSAFLS